MRDKGIDEVKRNEGTEKHKEREREKKSHLW
jgi:hypothetical protein